MENWEGVQAEKILSFKGSDCSYSTLISEKVCQAFNQFKPVAFTSSGVKLLLLNFLFFFHSAITYACFKSCWHGLHESPSRTNNQSAFPISF